MSKQHRELHRQSIFSVRITNDVDDGFLKWINGLNGRDILARTALEALYMAYSNQLELPGRWVPTPTAQMSQLPREVLGYIAGVPSQSEESKANSIVNSEPVREAAQQSTNQPLEQPLVPPSNVDNEALRAAMRFLDDDDF